MNKLLAFAWILLLVAPLAHAGCSLDAYDSACRSCSFDASGKMDDSCYNGKKASGTACVSAAFPKASAQYALGKCPGIDACADQLSSCKSQDSIGSDKEDCENSAIRGCFIQADSCVTKAAANCGENIPCVGSSAIIFLVFLGMLFLRRE